MQTVFQWGVVAAGLAAVAVTLLSLSPSPRWPVRIWDFPRVQIAAVAAISALVYLAFFRADHPAEWVFLAATAAATAWQIRRIFPYTPLARQQVRKSVAASNTPQVRLLIANVLMENSRHDLLLDVIRETDPDVILTVEVDERWDRALAPLRETYPHVVNRPQGNYYGMTLLSRLPIVESRVEFLVQDDIPSVHATVELRGGARVKLHGLHPRPPEPIRDQDATPRDAELVLVGKAIGDTGQIPTIVAGDLNDVAWSDTSLLFLRLSGLLDPRVGRGFYNSFNANNPFCRYPLDHVYHSNHFRLVELRRLRHVGSDHFPMFVHLSYEPAAKSGQPETPQEPGDERQAAEKLREQAEASATGDDRPGRGESDKG